MTAKENVQNAGMKLSDTIVKQNTNAEPCDGALPTEGNRTIKLSFARNERKLERLVGAPQSGERQ